MSSDGTARRYAEALFEIGKSSGKLIVFQQNAEEFVRLLDSSKDLMLSLSHPNIRRVQRKAIIDQVLAKCSYDIVFSNFVRLVVERGRISYFSKILSAYTGLRDESDGRLRGVVVVASSLSPDQRNRLRAKVQKKFGRDIVLEERIDANVIGGFRLEIDGRVYDSSVQRHLERLRESMVNRL